MNKGTLLKSFLICMVFLGSLLFTREAVAAVPSAPTHLIAVAGDATSIGLSWQDNSSNEHTFNIYRKTDGTSYAMIGQVGPNRVIYGDSGLKPGTKYYYVVKACNSSGLSASSNTASDATKDAVVVLTSPNGGEEWEWNETRNITWTSNGEGFEAWIRYTTEEGGYWPTIARVPNTNSYSWVLPNENSTHARVEVCLVLDGIIVARDRSYNDFTIKGTVSGIILTIPIAPSDLNWSYLAPNLNLSWVDNSINEGGFRIERQIGSSAFTLLGTAGVGATSYSDSSTTPGNIYTYRVCAYNIMGRSNYSNEVSFHFGEMLVTPATPSGLTADPASSSVRLSWVNGGPFTGHEIESQTGSSAFAKIAETGEGLLNYTATGLSEAGTYTYRVRAFTESASGHRAYSEYSNSASASIASAVVPPTTEPTDPAETETGNETVLRFYIDSTEYYVQGPSDSAARIMTMDTAPIISGGRTLLPISYVSMPLGADVNWNGALEQVAVHLGSQTIVLWINNNTARVNDVETVIDPLNPAVTPIIVPPGRTMMPLSFIALNLGCQVDWNPALREVTVTYPKL